MTQVQPIINESVETEREELREQHLSQTPIDPILQKLSRMELPAKEHFERYMRHKWRLNHKPRTLQSSFTSVMLFLDFCGKSGKRDLGEIERVDLEAFIEHEQDRGIRISTVRTRLACIIAFLHFLMEQDVISGSLLRRSIKLKLPDTLPRAMNPVDVSIFDCNVAQMKKTENSRKKSSLSQENSPFRPSLNLPQAFTQRKVLGLMITGSYR